MATSHRRQIPCNLIVRDADEATPELIHSFPYLVVNFNNKGIRLSFVCDPDCETFSWYSADLTVTESTLYHITIELPPRRFALNSRELTSEETSAFESHLPEDTSGYKVVEINVSCGSSTTVTGFGLPFHGANETVDSWVNQHTPIEDIISLPEILHQRTFTLLLEANSAEITHIVNNINSQSIPPTTDTAMSESLVPLKAKLTFTGIGGTWTGTADRSLPTEEWLFPRRYDSRTRTSGTPHSPRLMCKTSGTLTTG
ncbi:hypothetical protein ACKRZS_004225 [Fusarium odoratissimum]